MSRHNTTFVGALDDNSVNGYKRQIALFLNIALCMTPASF